MANGWLGLPVTDLPPGSEHGIIRHWKEGLLDGAPGRGLSPSRQATYSNHLTIGTNVLECICYASAMFAPPMASPRLILLNHPESLRPARLPRLCRGPSRGLCRGAFRNPARNVRPLTPSISLRLIQALSYTQITRETPRIPSLVFNSLRTLSFSVSCKSCVCHSYANSRGVYQQFPTWNESLAACNPSKVPVVLEASSRKIDHASNTLHGCSRGSFAPIAQARFRAEARRSFRAPLRGSQPRRNLLARIEPLSPIPSHDSERDHCYQCGAGDGENVRVAGALGRKERSRQSECLPMHGQGHRALPPARHRLCRFGKHKSLDARGQLRLAGSRRWRNRDLLDEHAGKPSALGRQRSPRRQQSSDYRRAAAEGTCGPGHGDVAVFLRRSGGLSHEGRTIAGGRWF